MSRDNAVAVVLEDGLPVEWVVYEDHARDIQNLTKYDVEWLDEDE